jgi:hypothetical protein
MAYYDQGGPIPHFHRAEAINSTRVQAAARQTPHRAAGRRAASLSDKGRELGAGAVAEAG